MWLYSGYLYMLTILITPICVLTISSPSWVGKLSIPHFQVQWLVIYSIYAMSYVARILQFTAVIVMITNVSYPDFRGKVNGIGQVFASLGRFIVSADLSGELQGPTIATNVYAWSIKQNYPWPFDFGLIFYVRIVTVDDGQLLGIIQLAQTLLIVYMDDSANHSTPTIRRFVKMEMEKRGVEMVELKKEQGDIKKEEPGEKSNEEQDTNIVVIPDKFTPCSTNMIYLLIFHFALQLLALHQFSCCFYKVFILDIIALLANCEHSCLCTHITQIRTIKSICEFAQRIIVYQSVECHSSNQSLLVSASSRYEFEESPYEQLHLGEEFQLYGPNARDAIMQDPEYQVDQLP